METEVKKLYEAMYLIDTGEATSDWEGINAAIKNILDKSEAEVVSFRKWDECKLAYEIDHKSRGTYFLCYFNAPPESIRVIERNIQLSEKIMRVLILKADHLTQEDLEKGTPSELATKRIEQAAEKLAQAEQEAAEAAKVAAEPEQESEAVAEVATSEVQESESVAEVAAAEVQEPEAVAEVTEEPKQSEESEQESESVDTAEGAEESKQ